MNDLPKVYYCVCSNGGAVFHFVNQNFSERAVISNETALLMLLARNKPIGIEPFPQLKIFLERGKYTDFAYFPHILPSLLLISQKVVEAYEGELEQYGKLYLTECEAAPVPYYFYQPTRVVEAVDLRSISEKDTRYQPGAIYYSISYSEVEFIPENIKDLLLFKDSHKKPPQDLFVSERFLQIAKKKKLTGLHKDTYKPIWPRPESSEPQTGPRVDLADLNL